MRYEQNIVFIGAHTHIWTHERYGSTYIPLGPLGHSPRLEQSPKRDIVVGRGSHKGKKKKGERIIMDIYIVMKMGF